MDRREKRITINKEFDSFDSFVSEYVLNISRHGAFIRCNDPPAVGTEIDLNFTIIMEEIGTIKGVGKVVRINETPPGIGVVFTQINQYSKNLIERLLTASH